MFKKNQRHETIRNHISYSVYVLVPLVILVVVMIMFMEIVAGLERLSVEEKNEAKGFATYFVFD
jgi:hypothetical protein